MAISTYQVYLMKGTDNAGEITYSKLVDIKDFTDLGAASESLEVTTLSDGVQKFIPGIQTLAPLEFTANYNKVDFEELKDLEGVETPYAIWFGAAAGAPDGHDGKFAFSGQLTVFPVGAGVNEVLSMKISIMPSTAIDFA